MFIKNATCTPKGHDEVGGHAVSDYFLGHTDGDPFPRFLIECKIV